ncbi:MAG: UDP-N-acetylglucosamine 2-epimerase (non-hydrolyzing) [Nitrospirae bacterium]|nr:UDP-N-acetylglucosamine 2-epimerase (non-hydrolyzing) [Nitrospirota bacterium]
MKIATVVGARPNFIKAAAVSRAIAAHNKSRRRKIREILIHTGQHYDYEMSAIFFRELRLPRPKYHLGVGSGSHGHQTAKILLKIEPVLMRERPDLILVYGDTNSTLAGALAAAKLGVPIAHVEAGLRSFKRSMPEEVNRVLTDHLSTFLFCPSRLAVRNLRREGISQGVHEVGDVMHDILESCRSRLKSVSLTPALIGVTGGDYALATIHRAENTDNPDRLRGILEGLHRIAKSGLAVVFPLHPRTRKATRKNRISLSDLHVIPPVSYLQMLSLESRAKVILTDSGGVQKEAYWLAVPCVTLRDETEWTETVHSGWNTLAGFDPTRICSGTLRMPAPQGQPRLYGNGTASTGIVRRLLQSEDPRHGPMAGPPRRSRSFR